jgi:hypothetical protein
MSRALITRFWIMSESQKEQNLGVVLTVEAGEMGMGG